MCCALGCRCNDLIGAQLPRSELTTRQIGTSESSYLGLADIKMLCDVNENTCATLRVLPDEVVFELTAQVMILTDRGQGRPPQSQSEPTPPPLSQPQNDLVLSSIPGISTGGDGESPVASEEMEPDKQSGIRGLIIVHADDDIMPRIFMESVLEFVHADPSSLIMGEQYEELLTLPQTVMSLANARGHDKVIVILDRFLEIHGWPALDGTVLCRHLREKHHFNGLVVILSANDERQSVENSLRAGADAHIVKGLNSSVGSLTETLANLHAHKFRKSQTELESLELGKLP